MADKFGFYVRAGQDSVSFLGGKRVVVTGGAGFLGREVCAALRTFAPAQVFVPRSREFDLRSAEAIKRLFDLAEPEVVLHLAAVVGGVGRNRSNAGRFFYKNAIMGTSEFLIPLVTCYKTGISTQTLIQDFDCMAIHISFSNWGYTCEMN